MTIQFGTAPDQMYYFGDLAFWCIAEGTCGFFIICVPCMPKIIKETFFGRRIRSILGFKRTTKPTPGGTGSGGPDRSMNAWNTSTHGGAVKVVGKQRGPVWGTTSNAYYEMGDDDIALTAVQRADTIKTDSEPQTDGSASNSLDSERQGGVRVTTTTTVVRGTAVLGAGQGGAS